MLTRFERFMGWLAAVCLLLWFCCGARLWCVWGFGWEAQRIRPVLWSLLPVPFALYFGLRVLQTLWVRDSDWIRGVGRLSVLPSFAAAASSLVASVFVVFVGGPAVVQAYSVDGLRTVLVALHRTLMLLTPFCMSAFFLLLAFARCRYAFVRVRTASAIGAIACLVPPAATVVLCVALGLGRGDGLGIGDSVGDRRVAEAVDDVRSGRSAPGRIVDEMVWNLRERGASKEQAESCREEMRKVVDRAVRGDEALKRFGNEWNGASKRLLSIDDPSCVWKTGPGREELVGRMEKALNEFVLVTEADAAERRRYAEAQSEPLRSAALARFKAIEDSIGIANSARRRMIGYLREALKHDPVGEREAIWRLLQAYQSEIIYMRAIAEGRDEAAAREAAERYLRSQRIR